MKDIETASFVEADDRIDIKSVLTLCDKYKGLYMYLPNKSGRGVILYTGKVRNLLQHTERTYIRLSELRKECEAKDSENVLQLYKDIKTISHSISVTKPNISRKFNISKKSKLDKVLSKTELNGFELATPIVKSNCIAEPLACIYDKSIVTMVTIYNKDKTDTKIIELHDTEILPNFVRNLTNKYGDFLKGLETIFDIYKISVDYPTILKENIFKNYSIHKIARKYITEEEWIKLGGCKLPWYLRDSDVDLTFTNFVDNVNDLAKSCKDTSISRDVLIDKLEKVENLRSIYDSCSENNLIENNSLYKIFVEYIMDSELTLRKMV